MLVLICYDINTKSAAGKTRLRKIAQLCEEHAQRVQHSLYEASLDWNSYLQLKDQLTQLIDETEDSIMFYRLGRNWKQKVERFGNAVVYDPEGLLLID